MADQIRVRFAPSPTGFLHVGGARTALYNWLLARRTGGVFVLRIEDTDRERSSGEMTQAILDGMTWLGLNWDEGPVHQADGLERHKGDVGRLLAQGAAYRCFCTPEELQARRDVMKEEYRYDRRCAAIPADESVRRAEAGEPFAVRFRVPEGDTAWDDEVHGDTRFKNESIEDFIILRTDGTPIYNLAVVSDDIDMRITHVIRGDDHIANTPKQILLYQAMGAAVPRFAHLPMILGPDGKRLSKRHGATAVGQYAEQGILPEAMNNFLALLGWNAGDDVEVMTMDELVQRFSLDRVNKKSAVFDTAKLEWMNGQHIALTPAENLLPLVAPLLVSSGLLAAEEVESRREWLLHLLQELRIRGRTTLEIAAQARTYLVDEVEQYDEASIAKHWKNADETAQRLAAVRAALAAVEPWTAEGIDAALRATAESAGVGLGKVAQPLRIALVGQAASPGIDFVVHTLGRDRVLRRIDRALERLRGAAA
ncbi:MAG TPA: glutamate--tRNA ligase [Longimicrobium sp.]|jgi:glutamyl-tRNA synthetase|uniref:glutamate--tRNA ligase n=1 Tax=Longimicrobium sp. TaxID=2029185 RepID=UPI002EDAA18F